MRKGAFATGVYRNIFAEMGYDEQEVEKRKEEIFHTLFYGNEEERIYHPVGSDMGYIEDTGNHDVRTEGMSYGMMMCVQMDKREEFDRLWNWAKTYMYMEDGENAGYFAWSCRTDGSKNAHGAAPDGEEFFAMALFFASHRWGNRKGIYHYSREAQEILHACIHKGENGEEGRAMWDTQNYLIRFVTDVDFSDPSYHLPHFYELFGLWAEENDRLFFKKAAAASRAYLKSACHPVTGLCAEYAEFDGTPYESDGKMWGGRHDWYYSDAYRTVANIALDYQWFAADEWEKQEAENVQKFFCETLDEKDRDGVYLTDGTVLKEKALHPTAVISVNAQASLAAGGKNAVSCVQAFWNTPLRTGDRRYYDNCLYFFAFLALSGNYRIY
ncbi:glycosyl hydrolase family 8 [Murimonas intestini]|uniref:Oligosaccharide reducing-end xylanase n=1 Tax=Murimonas intestini TaxID=1337051 RepID=A0AB73T6V0_9FIRM|nr:glycosyl hydrolase family 8 [Murimonas intestini]MCR1841318.1 glycosyl hydrolase family 8 [Murimonas intestini]MCR1866236.1 glycosyl hydrolase family 8 [Murimonas intestini]MCR1882647.1 glycosyl hydrolase family 8 [Murimonas intestini]